MKNFTTDRLKLERIEPADFNEIMVMFGEKDIFKYIEPLQDLSRAEHILKLHRKVKEAEEGVGFIWAARLKKDDELVGLINLNPIPDTHDIQIGWILSEKYRGKGYAYEASKVIFDFGKNDWKVNPIFAVIEEGNYPSEKIALKLGLDFRHYFTQFGVKLKMFSYVQSEAIV